MRFEGLQPTPADTPNGPALTAFVPMPRPRPVLVELRFTPERVLGAARLRISPQDSPLPVSERPIFGPTMTLSLPPGSYVLDVTARRHTARVQINVTAGMAPTQIDLRRRTGADPPRFDRAKLLATSLAGLAVTQVLAGAGVLLVGATREGSASRRNEGLLMDALVDAAAPVPQQPTGLALVEADYSTARYHRDLSRAATLEVAGGAVLMAGVGAGLAGFTVATQSRLRVAYIELGFGAAMTAGGAACLALFVRDRSALLSTTDPTQRVTTADLQHISATKLGGGLLTGLGIGLLVYPAIALLSNGAKRRRGQTARVAPYMAPGHAGLTFQGRF